MNQEGSRPVDQYCGINMVLSNHGTASKSNTVREDRLVGAANKAIISLYTMLDKIHAYVFDDIVL